MNSQPHRAEQEHAHRDGCHRLRGWHLRRQLPQHGMRTGEQAECDPQFREKPRGTHRYSPLIPNTPILRRCRNRHVLALLPAEAFRQQESEFQRLARVQPRIATCVVTAGEVGFRDRLRAAQTLRHVLSRHLQMHAAGMAAFGRDAPRRSFSLLHHAVEGARLQAGGRLYRVAVHRIAGPDDGRAFLLHRADEARKLLAHLVGAEARDQRDAPGLFSGLRMASRRTRSSSLSVGPHFSPMGFLTPRQNSTCALSGWRVRSPIQII